MREPTPSKVGNTFEHYLEMLRLALPEHLELDDADDLFENPPEQLSKGYGLVVEPGQNKERCIGTDSYYWERDFTMVITRDYAALRSDPKLRQEKVRALLEDLHAILKKVLDHAVIVKDGVPVAFKINAARDSGPKVIEVNDNRFLFIELTVSAEYRELTS